MFDNVNWNKIINNILFYIEKDWKYLIIKADVSQTSYSAKFYYSKNNDDFIDLYNAIEQEKVSVVNNDTMSELKKITEKFNDYKEKMFLTIKVENKGNVKVIYRDIKEENKLPWDEKRKYLQLNENDKIMW